MLSRTLKALVCAKCRQDAHIGINGEKVGKYRHLINGMCVSVCVEMDE